MNSIVQDKDLNRVVQLIENGYEIQDVLGDGYCRYYSSIIGMCVNGRLPKILISLKGYLVAAMYKMRKDLSLFISKEASVIWESVPKTTNGSLRDDYLHCIDLELVQHDMNISKMWDERIDLELYIFDVSIFPQEHMEKLGLIALTTCYKITIVVFWVI